jgi:hypothetical protein
MLPAAVSSMHAAWDHSITTAHGARLCMHLMRGAMPCLESHAVLAAEYAKAITLMAHTHCRCAHGVSSALGDGDIDAPGRLVSWLW